MKRTYINITFFAFAAVMLYACKKQAVVADTKETNTLHPVTFNTSGFKAYTESITTQQSGLKVNEESPITGLYTDPQYMAYTVYNSSNTLIRDRIYNYGSSGFSTVKDSLPNGTYTAIFIASPIPSYEYRGSQLYFSFDGPNIQTKWGQFPPVFIKKLTFTVGSGGYTQAVVLNRVTAQLQVKIEDAIPAEAKSIEVSATGELGAYSYALELPVQEPVVVTGAGSAYPETTTPYTPQLRYTNTLTAGQVNFGTTPMSVLNTVSPLTVTIKILNTTGNVLFLKTIPNVTFQRNTRTILKGKMFTNSATGTGIDIGFSTSFAADSVKAAF